jgi:hypothetical protein
MRAATDATDCCNSCGMKRKEDESDDREEEEWHRVDDTHTHLEFLGKLPERCC